MRRALSSVLVAFSACSGRDARPPEPGPAAAPPPSTSDAKPPGPLAAPDASAEDAKPPDPADAPDASDAPRPVKRGPDGRCEPLPRAGDRCAEGESFCVISWGEPGGWSLALWCRQGRWEIENEVNLP